MYAIEESVQKINGEVVETFQREICDGNTNLEIEAGTTGYKGGCCRNAGGRTYLSLLCLSGDFFFDFQNFIDCVVDHDNSLFSNAVILSIRL